jgi:hypothetical protein
MVHIQGFRGVRRAYGAFSGCVLSLLMGCQGTHREFSAAPAASDPSMANRNGMSSAAPPNGTDSSPEPVGSSSPGTETTPGAIDLEQGSRQGVAASVRDAGPPPCAEGSTESCGPEREEGTCKFGTKTCNNGAWGDCVGAVFPKARDCSSAQDNDCDGQPDNTVDDVCRCPAQASQSCDARPGLDGKGPCKAGTQACVLGNGNGSSDWGPCSGSVAPTAADSCGVAGDDANCDGVPNGGCTCVEGSTVACGPDKEIGVCKKGTSTCKSGAFTACQGAVFPAQRDCSSPLDNDCDGLPDNTIDNVCTCLIGDVQACGAHPDRDGNGPCRAGTQTCQAGMGNVTSRFGACTGSVGPAQRDSCSVLGDDTDCSGNPNTGCQCVAGQGNGACSGDPNNSHCSAQGTCGPCQTNADCSLVSGGRSSCSSGQCVLPTPTVTVQRFAWTSRQAAVDMGPTQNRACFLTGVGGKFNAAGDNVSIQSQGGRWVLTGGTDPSVTNPFVEARAACLTASGVTAEVSVRATPAGRGGADLESSTTHICFLTGVSGNFRTGSENVQLGATPDGIWHLGDSAQQAAGITGSARCIPMQPFSATFLLAFGSASPSISLDPVLTGACYLTRVSGEFEAEGDLVQTDWLGNTWVLERSDGSALQASAVCFGKNDGSGVPSLP